MSWRRQAAALAVAGALAVLHTWPLTRDLAGQSRLDNADTALNTWIVAWVAHALPRHPLHVFDAPIFHPERRTLAYSEHLLAQGAMAMPLRAAGLSPTATYNLLVILGHALGAWAMWRLVTAWTGDAAAGAVAGCAFAFNAHLLTRFAHLQALHGEFVPLVLLGVDRLATHGRRRDALLLALGLVLVGLTSIYLLVFVAAAAVAGVATRRTEWGARAGATIGLTLAALVMAAVCLLPVLLPYWQVNHELGLERSIADAAQYGATWHDYLATGGRLHYALWSARFFGDGDAFFPGLTVTALAVLALADRRVHRGRVRMLVAIAALGVALSFGPALPLYGWLHEHLAPLRAIRVASRWAVLMLIATAVLAGLGAAALRARLAARPALATTVALILPALVTAEALRAPLAFTPTPSVPPIYARLAGVPATAVLEFPIFPAAHFNLNAPYLLAQIVHGHPIVAGYSGFAPPGYDARLAALARLPEDTAHRELVALGISHLVLHVAPLVAGFGQAAVDGLDEVPWLRREIADDEARVYRVLDVTP